MIGAAVATSFELSSATILRAVVPPEAKRRVLRAASVELALHANAMVRVEDDTTHISIGFVLRDANDAPVAVADGMAVYAGALGGADVVHRVHAEGTEDYVVFETKPAREELTYDVDVSHVAGLRLVSNTLEFLDEGGAPRLRVRAPYLVDRAGERRRALLAVAGCAHDTSPIAPWRRSVVSPGAPACAVVVRWGGAVGDRVTYPAVLDPSWVTGGSMVHPRNAHAAVRLADGRVLVAGGYLAINSSTYVPNAELFDPATTTWAATSSMNHGRAHYSAVLFPNGPKAAMALMASGDDQLLPSAEYYNPVSATWTDTAPMNSGRDGAKIALLADGRVLVAGGCTAYSSTCDVLAKSAEVYDPVANVWTATANGMADPRGFFTLTTLADGRVLAAGGCKAFSPNFNCFTSTSTADAYDPATNTWTAVGPMAVAQQNDVAVLLPSNEVLVAGGMSNGVPSLKSLAFDPVSNQWALVGDLGLEHDEATLSLVPSGHALVAGSWGTQASSSDVSAQCELYDPMLKTWANTAPIKSPHGNHTATVLADGRVLVAGGFTAGPNFTLLESGDAEIYDENLNATCAGGPALEASCADCMNAQCCAEITACAADAECTADYPCFDQCGTGSAAQNCLTICSSAHPNGYADFKLLVVGCMAPKCAAVCDQPGVGSDSCFALSSALYAAFLRAFPERIAS